MFIVIHDNIIIEFDKRLRTEITSGLTDELAFPCRKCNGIVEEDKQMDQMMDFEKYTPNSVSVGAILGLISGGDIAIPEIQRPFVWKKIQVRDLLDSLYKGYPTGYLIIWKNPDVKLKDGKISAGKKILIDGQQRVTALMTAIAGIPVTNSNYKKERGCERTYFVFFRSSLLAYKKHQKKPNSEKGIKGPLPHKSTLRVSHEAMRFFCCLVKYLYRL